MEEKYLKSEDSPGRSTPSHSYHTRCNVKSLNTLLLGPLVERRPRKSCNNEFCDAQSDDFPDKLPKETLNKMSGHCTWRDPCNRPSVSFFRGRCVRVITYLAIAVMVYHYTSCLQQQIKDLTQDLHEIKHQFGSIEDGVQEKLDKIQSDKTGRSDFALETAGGRIEHLTEGTQNFDNSKNSIFGITLCEGLHGPRALIQIGTSPGECWAFKGSSGGVVIKLLGEVLIDAVSLEHINKNLSPTGHVATAPKDFTVWGMRTSKEKGMLLGEFTYDINGPLVQIFPVKKTNYPFEYVELKVLSNYGHPDFTCVYRFRVHGGLSQFPNGRKE